MDDNHLHAAAEAALTAGALLCMGAGYAAIRRGRVALHRALLLAAFAQCAAFLVVFVTRVVRFGIKAIEGDVSTRPLHFIVFAVHDGLAVATVPLVLVALATGLARRVRVHRDLAPLALLIWALGAATGLTLYVLTYHAPR